MTSIISKHIRKCRINISFALEIIMAYYLCKGHVHDVLGTDHVKRNAGGGNSPCMKVCDGEHIDKLLNSYGPQTH